jgi:hypothetical protein
MLFPYIAIIAFVGLLVGGFIFVRTLLANRPPKGSDPVPATVLQRIAFWGLLAGVLIVAAAAWMLITIGPEVVYDDDTLRLRFTGIVLTGVALFAALSAWIGVTVTRRAKLDERDLAVLARAPMVQGGLILVTLAAWEIGLQETFRGTPGIPMTYVHLIFWSCLAANMLALPIGILIGYRQD